MGRGHTTSVTAPTAAAVEPLPYPPGATWSMIAMHQPDRMVLPVEGRRSIYTSWPPGSFCEHCGLTGSEGYVGHVTGDRAHFPASHLHRACLPCARRSLQLEPGELTGHVCGDHCTDRLHLELVDVAGAEGAAAATDQAVIGALRTRGWEVADITRPPRPWSSLGGARMAVWIEPARALPWPASRSGDLWVL